MIDELKEALRLDVAQQLEDAADKYEAVISHENAPVEAFINLACLYWISTDYGIWTSHGLTKSFIDRAGERMYEVIEKAQNKFGEVPELTFWKRYFDFTTLGEPAFPVLALHLAVQPPRSLVPYFHIYSITHDPVHKANLERLYEEIKDSLTTKNRYILSIIERYIND